MAANFSTFTTTLYSEMSEFNIILLVVYSVIVLIGLTGNSLGVIVVRKTISMQTTTNLLLENVAIADIISLSWSVTPLVTSLTGKHATGLTGNYICKFFTGYSVTCITVAVKMSSLVVLATERYQAIVKPLTSNLTRLGNEHVTYVIVLLWFLSAVFSLPGFVYSEYNEKLGRCLDPWTIEKVSAEKWYIITAMVLTTIFSSCLFYCYFQILKGIFISKTVCSSEIASSRRSDMKTKRKLAITSLTVTLTYIICHAPFMSFQVYITFISRQDILDNYEALYKCYRVTGAIMYVNACLNPFLYAFQSSNYRHNLKRIFVGRTMSDRAGRNLELVPVQHQGRF